MGKELVWDADGTRRYEAGVDKGVLFPMTDKGTYEAGVAWNGLINVNETPSGGETTKNYADNMVYAEMESDEEYGLSIECYTYPDAFEECQGEVEVAKGVIAGQQRHKKFGFSWRSLIGDDLKGTDAGYKIHLAYGCKAGVAEKDHATINENVEAGTFSYEVTTTKVQVKGHKPIAHIAIDSTRVDAEKLAKLEAMLYGGESTEPKFPTIDEVITLIGTEG